MTTENSTLWKYYVYELRDPDNGEVFYVGKGSADRVEAHDADAPAMGARIAEINRRGKEPLRVIVGRFEDEVQAFVAETLLIKWVYGKSHLENRIHGHGHRYIREKGNFSPIEGIDNAPKDRTSLMRLLELDSAIEALRGVRPELAQASEELTDFFLQAAKEFGDSDLIYRTTRTRISFFKAIGVNKDDLNRRRLRGQVCRIFFYGGLAVGGRLHICFNRPEGSDFKPEKGSGFETRLGVVGGEEAEGFIDLVLDSPGSWRNNECLIKELLKSALEA